MQHLSVDSIEFFHPSQNSIESQISRFRLLKINKNQNFHMPQLLKDILA